MMNTGIYIHIPFCIKKCNYCDFASFVNGNFEEYFSCLEKEIKMYSDYLSVNAIDTIFIGGGTPSFVDYKYIGKILKLFDFNASAEVTIECNPKTVTEDKLKAYKDFGINRISIGMQSANDNELSLLGRVHNYNDFLTTYELVRKNGFKNVNVDVMFGIPEQTIESYTHTLNELIRLNPEHISAYSLIIEENTPFYSMDLSLPSEEEEREMFLLTSKLLKCYERYEISNYAKPGYECKHNIKYWSMKSFLGFGVNAYSFFNNSRHSNFSALNEYINAVNSDKKPVKEILSEDCEELYKDAVITGLRLSRGIDLKQIKNDFGKALYEEKKEKIDKYISMGYMTLKDDYLAFTENGFSISNYILSELI